MKFTAAIVLAAASLAMASYAPPEPKYTPAPTYPTKDEPAYPGKKDDYKNDDYKPETPKYDDKKEPKYDDKKEPKYDDKKEPKYDDKKDYKSPKEYKDCDEDEKKNWYPKGKPSKEYDDCSDDEKKDYYPHGKPQKPSYHTTKVVYDYTTYCPDATTFTYGTKTYSVTKPTYVSVDCAYGCTVEQPVYTAPATYCDYCSMTTSAYAPVATSTYAAAKPTYAVTAGAAKVAGAGLAAVAGLAAALL